MNITLLQKTKNVSTSKTCNNLIASDEHNIMIATKEVLEERKSVPLI